MARTEECILYRDFENGEVLNTMTALMNSYEAKEGRPITAFFSEMQEQESPPVSRES